MNPQSSQALFTTLIASTISGVLTFGESGVMCFVAQHFITNEWDATQGGFLIRHDHIYF